MSGKVEREDNTPKELERLRPAAESTKEETPAKDKPSKEPNKKWRILLEPVLLGSMTAINLGQTSLQNFYLRKACTVDLKYSSSICDKGVGENFKLAEAASQVVVSQINVSRSFVGCLLATVVLLFVGPWSDCSRRRKPVIILPLIGMTIMTSAVLLMLTFPGASTVQVLYAVQVPISLGGNFGLLLAASFSYIGDVCHSTGADVTRAMGSHRAAMQIANVLGAVTGPLMYRHLGFYGVFCTVLMLQVLSLIYVIVTVQDVNINTENKVSVFNPRLPLNAIQCLLKKRSGYKRAIILLMLVVTLGDRMVLSAEVLISYMYYRMKFAFDDVWFGFFLAYRNIISFMGTLLILAVLKRRMKLSDETVGIVSCVSFLLATSGLIASTTTLFVFMIPLIGILSQGSQVVQRPITNKQILPTEQGKIYSVMGALESAVQTWSSPLYSLIYSKTAETIPDAWLIPGLALAIIQLLAFVASRRLNQKSDFEKNEADNNKEKVQENVVGDEEDDEIEDTVQTISFVRMNSFDASSNV